MPEDKRPPDSACPGKSKLDQGVLERLGHRVLALPCSDASHLFVCLSCKFYSSGAQVLGLGRECKPPTITGIRNFRKLKKGLHPDKEGVFVHIDEFIALM